MNKLKAFFEELRSLDPNDPGRWPLGIRLGTAVLLFALAATAGYYWFVWKAKRPELLEARAKETELWTTLETKARKAANLQAYKDQLAEMERSFGAMGTKGFSSIGSGRPSFKWRLTHEYIRSRLTWL